MLSYFKQIKDNFKWKHYLNYIILGEIGRAHV